MMNFNITPADRAIEPKLIAKIDNLTKPKGSLGVLEELALKIGLIEQTLTPKLQNPHHIVFAADHGITDENVSLSPKEVTLQMVYNFVKGGAGINFLARQHNFALKIVDCGVDYDFPESLGDVVNAKIAKCTQNYLHTAAMSYEQAEHYLRIGAEQVEECYKKGCNVISFGEMGISNTSSSSIWMSKLLSLDLKECVGAGSDHTGDIIAHKYDVLSRSVANYNGDNSPYDIMCYFGGFEMVAAVGAMLKAAELKMVVIVDGFIMSACALMASKLYSAFLDYAIFGHQGDECGHKLMLDAMGVKAVLHLGLRLGEGTGAICAYPILESSVRMINEMSQFGDIEVTKYF